MSIDLIVNGLQQGMILAIVAYGIMIPFRFLNFPDLTAEGAYPLGGAICAVCLSSGHPIFISILLGAASAGIAGICTGLIHLKLRIDSMLSGIILSTMIYSINLRIMGKPNISLFDSNLLFGADITDNIITIALIILIFIIPFVLFLYTDIGLRFMAVGENAALMKSYKVNVNKYLLFGLFLSCSLIGLAGGIIVQLQSYMDISMGIGIIIHGLTSLMIGEAIIGNQTLERQLLAPLIGAVIYQQAQGIALSMGLAPSDLKLFTGVVVLCVIATKCKRKNIL